MLCLQFLLEFMTDIKPVRRIRVWARALLYMAWHGGGWWLGITPEHLEIIQVNTQDKNMDQKLPYISFVCLDKSILFVEFHGNLILTTRFPLRFLRKFKIKFIYSVMGLAELGYWVDGNIFSNL